MGTSWKIVPIILAWHGIIYPEVGGAGDRSFLSTKSQVAIPYTKITNSTSDLFTSVNVGYMMWPQKWSLGLFCAYTIMIHATQG